MSGAENKLEEIQKELQWISVKDYSEDRTSSLKTTYKILVPIGVLVTTGVLGTGLYYMVKRNSRKQQLFMRYRVLAQGLTLMVATFGIFHLKFTS